MFRRKKRNAPRERREILDEEQRSFRNEAHRSNVINRNKRNTRYIV